MIDNFSILLSHALLAIALWRLMNREDLDHEQPPIAEEEPQGFVKRMRPAPPKSGTAADA